MLTPHWVHPSSSEIQTCSERVGEEETTPREVNNTYNHRGSMNSMLGRS